MKTAAIFLTDIEFSDISVLQIGEAIRSLAAVKLVRQEYTTQQVDEPKTLADQQRRLERRVHALRDEAIALELSRLRGEAAQDRTPDERRVERDAKIKDLEAKLAR